MNTATTALQAIDNEQFGNLIELPKILDANKASTINATKAATAIIAPLQTADITKMELAVIESSDKQLNDLYVKLKTTEASQKAKREPFTQFFDTLRGLFTAEEKAVVTLQDTVKTIRNNIAREKIRRENERKAVLQKEIDKKNEAVDIATWIGNRVAECMSNNTSAVINKMNNAFYGQGVDTFDEYEAKLRKFNPAAMPADTIKAVVINANTPSYKFHSFEQVSAFFDSVITTTYQQMADECVKKIVSEQDRLIELIPSRKAELIRIANDEAAKAGADKRIADEQKQREADAAAALANQQQQSTAQAENAKLTELFDAHSVAAPAIDLAKGTSVKKKYKPTTVGAFAAIMQSWLKYEMPGMSIADLEKKLSFMLTAANKRLNAGEKLEAPGLLIEDDITTRGSKTTD